MNTRVPATGNALTLVLLTASLFWFGSGCSTDHRHHTAEDGATEKHASLTLNNGAKWNADSITNVNVELLSEILDEPIPGTLEEYHLVSQELQQALDKLLMDCRMKGKEHDTLHQWLEPIVESNHLLAKSTSVEDAKLLYEAIRKRVGEYPAYFE